MFLKKKIINIVQRIISYRRSYLVSLASLFPILISTFLFRSFLYEPFQIPSGSMIPSLLVGDFILVKKFSYRLINPIDQSTIFRIQEPRRGDIVVFKYPLDSKINFVKRIIGIPGDKVIYDCRQKELKIFSNYLNDLQKTYIPVDYSVKKESEWTLFMDDMFSQKKQSHRRISIYDQTPKYSLRQEERVEKIGQRKGYTILSIPGIYTESHYKQRYMSKNQWIVPKRSYFVMGDNRDNSSDSRSWGLISEDDLIGKVTMVWFSLNKVEHQWPTGIRFERIGKVY
ncbi:signal peptidase I [Candidatus Riesia pediculischaeffi]|uniref:signal peptidase I n=1 Tax=Candidatus Riesia pediculischaeffi TaxID=428411 RepID=UPI0009E2BD67|nr:signal peptidase I [Candidatus Riesia pediculischaeffi]